MLPLHDAVRKMETTVAKEGVHTAGCSSSMQKQIMEKMSISHAATHHHPVWVGGNVRCFLRLRLQRHGSSTAFCMNAKCSACLCLKGRVSGFCVSGVIRCELATCGALGSAMHPEMQHE